MRQQVVNLQPVKFLAVKKNGRTTVIHYTAKSLFDLAGLRYDQGGFTAAVKHYLLLIRDFPKSAYLRAAHYNVALSYEALKQYRQAVQHYRRVVQLAPEHEDATDSLMRSAECQKRLSNWEGVIAAINALTLDRLSLADRLECIARRGHAHLQLARYKKAVGDYRAVLRLYNDKKNTQLLIGNYWVSMAQFEIGQCYRKRFDTIKLRLPLESMRVAFDQKVTLFLRAQNQYLRTIYLHNNYWAVVAGYHAANLYESFYHQALRAEVPKDLSTDELAIYYDELKKKVTVLVRKAILIYTKNVEMSRRVGQNNQWVARSEKNLQRLKKILQNYEKERLERLKKYPHLALPRETQPPAKRKPRKNGPEPRSKSGTGE